MSNQLKPGDLVKLKTNNRQMIIKSIAAGSLLTETIMSENKFECSWYDGAKQLNDVFSEDALESIPPYYDIMHYANYE